MILYKYNPFSDPKIQEIKATIEMPEHPEILSINHGTYNTSGTIEALTGVEYFLTPRDAVEARIKTQKRILQREQEILDVAEKDLNEIV